MMRDMHRTLRGLCRALSWTWAIHLLVRSRQAKSAVKVQRVALMTNHNDQPDPESDRMDLCRSVARSGGGTYSVVDV